MPLKAFKVIRIYKLPTFFRQTQFEKGIRLSSSPKLWVILYTEHRK